MERSSLDGNQSHLFTVRLWAEDLGDGQSEWRGKVQHVSSGATRYFRDWSTLGGIYETFKSTACSYCIFVSGTDLRWL